MTNLGEYQHEGAGGMYIVTFLRLRKRGVHHSKGSPLLYHGLNYMNTTGRSQPPKCWFISHKKKMPEMDKIV